MCNAATGILELILYRGCCTSFAEYDSKEWGACLCCCHVTQSRKEADEQRRLNENAAHALQRIHTVLGPDSRQPLLVFLAGVFVATLCNHKHDGMRACGTIHMFCPTRASHGIVPLLHLNWCMSQTSNEKIWSMSSSGACNDKAGLEEKQALLESSMSHSV